jgi:hypothetical protein
MVWRRESDAENIGRREVSAYIFLPASAFDVGGEGRLTGDIVKQ